MQSYTHLTLVERENLRILLEKGESQRQIAKEMGRNVSTISRELKRNGKKDGSYNAWWGSSLYIFRRKRCHRRYRIDNDQALSDYVREGLRKYWSPEIIAVKWKRVHPQAKLSHNTIYSAVKNKRLTGFSERTHLLHRGRKKYNRILINKIKPIHSIHDRPPEASMRQRIGDWEGDTLCGGFGKGHIFTCVDRSSRYLALGLIPGPKTADVTRKAVSAALKALPVFSLTLDNGTEFADHRGISEDLGVNVYFADPRSPWQRGSNENTNGLLRFFFPRNFDFRNLSQEELDNVALLLNSRPRKCLGWLSPLEVLHLH